MRKFFALLFMFVSVSVFAKQPIEYVTKTEFEWRNCARKTSFELDDFVGVWRDNMKIKKDFKLDSDLHFEQGNVNGACEVVSLEKGNLVLKCLGNFENNISEKEIKLKLYYEKQAQKFEQSPNCILKIVITIDDIDFEQNHGKVLFGKKSNSYRAHSVLDINLYNK